MSARIAGGGFVIAAWLAIPAAGMANPFNAENCRLAAPPPGAGDEIVRAEVAKIHPRRKNLPARYTGCQTTWLQAKGGWAVLGVAYFQNGEAVSYWTPPPDERLCEYRSGKAIGPHADKCPAFKSLPAESMAPGCAQKILGRGGNAGCQPD